MERKGRKKIEKQNRQGNTEMSTGMCGRGREIKARNKQVKSEFKQMSKY